MAHARAAEVRGDPQPRAEPSTWRRALGALVTIGPLLAVVPIVWMLAVPEWMGIPFDGTA